MKLLKGLACICFFALLSIAPAAQAAYDHGGADTDSPTFLTAYPDAVGTKLDSCTLCHTGGAYEKKPGTWVSLGSCQWCHYAYGYDAGGDIDKTLNPYGMDYRSAGRNVSGLVDIAALDSDGDGFTNGDEIAALRFPGNSSDDPAKVPAPYRIYTRETLESLNQHTQFMLMNTHKSGDYYATYGGVPIADLLDLCGILPMATGMTAFAPDGWAQYHPLDADVDPLLYHVYGVYPQADFYYEEEADRAVNPDGWCDYSAPACADHAPGQSIINENGLQLLLALTRDGDYLAPGELNQDNKLDGEGPFRIVTPQKNPGPPDQSSQSDAQEVIWPFDPDKDHNAGFATRSATMIRIEPLPPGTTDIDILEAGWDFVDEAKIVVYGALDPVPTVREKLDDLLLLLCKTSPHSYRRRILKHLLTIRIKRLKRMVDKGFYGMAVAIIEKHLLTKTDGFPVNGNPDHNDWITDKELQNKTYWALHEMSVLLKIRI